MEELYYESHGFRLSYDAEKRLGKAEWRGFLSSAEFRENSMLCMELAYKYSTIRWLADQKTMRAIRQDDLRWASIEIMPKILASPIRRMAIIVSVDIFNNMAMEQLTKRAGNLGDLVVKEFEDEATAMTWLLQPIPAATQA
ncbi:STAS/SEC14 domain-containing protein [Pontibacter cellulosilyticus]|uniref:STAS/SEC14 domain-containing protein n=1 Tax=Pontibacter cellulosilyticus TaxID=1720253 RepID=A0A923N990_9BACT|nr:STAS/SEC14 domain-containing protein [Pontibacter cellulosilyticus]MBC5994049.1 STAS/SEC14 domain-containing protein [Pontibacter cellulosilyticus]